MLALRQTLLLSVRLRLQMSALEPPAKRPRSEAAGAAAAVALGDPRVLVTLNVNGLKSRLLVKEKDETDASARSRADAHAAALIADLCKDKPDVIFLTEVHLKGHPQDQGRVEPVVASPAAQRKMTERGVAALQRLQAAPELAGFKMLMSLHAKERGLSGCIALLRPGLEPQSVSYNLEGAPGHHPEGRVILLEFATMRLLLTYSPNNGVKDESRSRRLLWDTQSHALLCAAHAKPIIWGGDLNIAPTEEDWNVVMNGVPGTTPDERRRFADMLSAGKLRDAWRSLHPGVRGGWTWRGDSYKGSGLMRLDHWIVSETLWSRVRSCEATEPSTATRGPRNEPASYYCGSDHWPLTLTLSEAA